MDLTLILLVLGGLIVLSTVLGLVIRSREGKLKKVRSRSSRDSGHIVDTGEFVGVAADPQLGRHATLVQFSTEYCTKCPGTAVYLGRTAHEYVGVRHIEVDVTHRPDLIQKYKIMQTPTVLILDETGTIAARMSGSPRPESVHAGLDIAIKKEHDSYVI